MGRDVYFVAGANFEFYQMKVFVTVHQQYVRNPGRRAIFYPCYGWAFVTCVNPLFETLPEVRLRLLHVR